jgi:hypothetical protein
VGAAPFTMNCCNDELVYVEFDGAQRGANEPFLMMELKCEKMFMSHKN